MSLDQCCLCLGLHLVNQSSEVMAKSTGVHDIGGLEAEFGPIDTREYGYQLWEMQVEEEDLVTNLIISAY